MQITSLFRILALTISTTSVVVRSHAQLPAFPGAQGAAQYVSGGRTGIVYHVTRLNTALDDPNRAVDGTFLYGLNNGNVPSGVPRTIVFDVAGVFHLGKMDTTNWTSGGNAWDATSRQGVGARNITIAGQTAPGPVIFMGGSLKPQGTNQILRNILFLPGYGMRAFWEPGNPMPAPTAKPTSYTMDAMDITGQHIMIDHCSAYYGSDETISCNEFSDNLTIQNCNVALAQDYNNHSYAHGFGGGTAKKLSFVQNLDAHIRSRMPRVGAEVGTGGWNDFRNSVFYNWLGSGGGYAGNGQWSYNNFIGNFILAGPGGDNGGSGGTITGGTVWFEGANPATTWAFTDGNRKDLDKDGDRNDDLPAVVSSSDSGDIREVGFLPAAMDVDIGVTLSARAALTNILRYNGVRWWERDYDFALGNTNAINTTDERLSHETYTGTGKVLAWADNPFNSDPNEGVEWRAYWALRMDTNGAAPFNRPAGWDTDQDGMPAYWEIQYGLDPNVADNNGDYDNDGYSNLEEYMNEVAEWPAPSDIYFNGTNTSRFAEIFNWQVNGVALNITNKGTVTTYTLWQPSKYDTAVISNSTVLVDCVGQHAGTLRLAPAVTNNATLNITNGWLKVSNTLEIAKAGTGTLNLSGGKLRVGTLTNGGGTASFNFTGGTLAADTVAFNLTNQGGTISPGGSPGQTHIIGDLIQDGDSTLAIDVNGTNSGQFDTVVVDGTATLDGALVITFTNGYVPPYGAVVTILTCASRNGTFASFDYPTNDVTMELVYSSTNVQLLVTASTFNSAPVFTTMSNHTVSVGITLLATNAAVDTDLPPQTLIYSLVNGPPAATLDTNTGVFTWRPDVTCSDTTNVVSLSVADNHIPSLATTQSFNVTVNALMPSAITNLARTGNQLVFTVNGQYGPDYAVEASTNLTDWSALLITNSPVMPFAWTNTEISSEPMFFYRIKAGPPLP
jgi:hypothetical protein